MPQAGEGVATAHQGDGRAVTGWLLFDWAAQPFFTLVLTFVFGPYFVNTLADSPVDGQASWGFATALAGFTIAFLSPVLGAIADSSGARKPWIGWFSVLFIAGPALLWFAEPGQDHAVALALVCLVIGTIGGEFATVFTNAMMPDLVSRDRLGRLSGNGWALGYAGGLVSLVLVLGFFAASPETGRTLLGLEPVFGLDPAKSEGDRASGPFSALWYLVFVLPLFLFVPDTPRRMPFGNAIRSGLSDLRNTLTTLPSHRPVLTFLLAHMIYKDGLAALFAFGGIYAASIFGWTIVQIGLFGIFLTITGTVGAVIGGVLDDRFGPKAVVSSALVIMIAGCAGIVSVDRETILFVVSVAAPDPEAGMFQSVPEIAYLLFGAMVGAASGPMQASSRTLLVDLSPPDRLTEFFGLYALSGKVTSFAAPLLVATVTALAASQRLGIGVILIFFVVGLAALRFVDERPYKE